MKIDVHTHILPETWPDLRERYGYGGFVQLEPCGACRARMTIDGRFFREIDDRSWSPERRTRDADETGVTVQVLSTVPIMFGYWAQPQDTLDLSRLLNDHIAEVVRRHPRRFVGLGTLPMQDAEYACRELDRCVKDLGLAGIEIGTHVNGQNLDDPDLFPALERAAEIGAAVFVHPWDMMAADRMTRHWFPWLVGMPAETALAVGSVLFGGVLERLPDLRILFAHGGGSFPGTLGRLEHGYRVRPDLCATQSKLGPIDQLGRFYVDSLTHDPAVLRLLLEQVGAGRIALGSDYPFPLGEHRPGEMIEAMDDLSAETKDRLLAGTALEFLGRKREEFGDPA
jgi:aminocarboxymuconate-semialdehyde decarboxylase